jgi:hypothetical protein
MTGIKQERGRERQRERERKVWGERDMVERENGVGHLRRWRGLILAIGLNQQHLRIS